MPPPHSKMLVNFLVHIVGTYGIIALLPKTAHKVLTISSRKVRQRELLTSILAALDLPCHSVYTPHPFCEDMDAKPLR